MKTVPTQTSEVAAITTHSGQKVVGKRIIAAIIDLGLWFIIFGIAAILFGQNQVINTNSTSTSQYGNYLGSGTSVYYGLYLTGWPELIYSISLFLYFVILEWKCGATLGKVAMGLKVRQPDGSNITLRQSLIRNALRIVDGFPYFVPYLTGLVAVSVSNSDQRLGDKAAKTVVIHASNKEAVPTPTETDATTATSPHNQSQK